MFRAFLLLLLLAAPAAAQFPSDSAVRAIIQQRVDMGRSSGIVVGLLEPDGRTRVVAYNERKHGEPVFDARTVFEIGSITKAFTGALLADMVARGEVKLDDPVQKYLPASVRVPTRGGKQITLLDLATQSSGLPRVPGNLNPQSNANPYAAYSADQLYAFLSSHELSRDIGVQYEYSNLGVGLLGHVLALRAGKTYEQLVKERILGPLGMSSTSITLSAEQKKRLAVGHSQAGDTVSNWDFQALASAGALRSTVEDMLKFLAAHIDTVKPLSRNIRRATVAQRPAGNAMMDIGLAWHIRKFTNEKNIVWHNGGTGGYRTIAAFDPVSRRGVVVLTNSSQSADDIGFHLIEPSVPLATLTPRVNRVAVAVSDAVLERYVGEYELTPAIKVAVTRTGNELYAQLTGQPPVRLWPENETDFFIKEVDAQVKFTRDAAGLTTSLTLFQNGQTLNARKTR
jgi:D-alanyl-D-alanine-carboxypeptidase/D-alanyl-D-alanine-endopeptidase